MTDSTSDPKATREEGQRLDDPTPTVTYQFVPVADQSTADQPTLLQCGRYRCVRMLGAGAFGTVYLAEDEQLGRLVAVKVPKLGICELDCEAKMLAALDHPHIVPVYDVGQTEHGCWYIVSKFVEGGTLAERMQQAIGQPEAISFAIALADALNYAHRQGFVHRDVKPANVLMDQNGQPLLSDFGLALHEDEQSGRRNERSGSPAFMAPEQVAGKSHHLDGRTDVWALGVLLYQLLTGRLPFRSKEVSLLFEEIRDRDPKPLRMINDTVPVELERIVLKCLAKSVSDRYATAGDLASDLRRWQTQTTSDTANASSQSRQRRTWLIATVAGLFILLGFVCWQMWKPHSSERTSETRNATPSPVPTSLSAEPLKADLDVLVWRGDQFLPIAHPQARPVISGDVIRVEVQLSRPAFVQLVWIAPDGTATRFYPEPHGTWDVPSDQRHRVISLPSDPRGGIPIQGEGGLEMVVLLATESPLSDTTNLRSVFADLPSQPTSDDRLLAYYENGRTSSHRDRAAGFADVEIVDNNPAVQLHALLKERLDERFDAIRAIGFAHAVTTE